MSRTDIKFVQKSRPTLEGCIFHFCKSRHCVTIFRWVKMNTPYLRRGTSMKLLTWPCGLEKFFCGEAAGDCEQKKGVILRNKLVQSDEKMTSLVIGVQAVQSRRAQLPLYIYNLPKQLSRVHRSLIRRNQCLVCIRQVRHRGDNLKSITMTNKNCDLFHLTRWLIDCEGKALENVTRNEHWFKNTCGHRNILIGNNYKDEICLNTPDIKVGLVLAHGEENCRNGNV